MHTCDMTQLIILTDPRSRIGKESFPTPRGAMEEEPLGRQKPQLLEHLRVAKVREEPTDLLGGGGG